MTKPTANQQLVNQNIRRAVSNTGGVYIVSGNDVRFTHTVKPGQKCYEKAYGSDFDLQFRGTEESVLDAGKMVEYELKLKLIGTWTENLTITHEE